ncbi:ABC transporter permease/substrate-binding protein [Catalinimonas niigatensis]|uniref:ABC transporter permease/substrate-binding protein n=1 Tax=Catalinimonas niigatensis TaxID=1397264 RepID=UPI002666E088|nr:ABC transporter permease/substrate-binding protein [Catalinimonas niigatensis]WPP51632.1 ABC transporter permease/substrate-binding protein [Catalinimonas niigatensis]
MLEDFLSFVVDHRREILEQTLEHIWITLISLAIATVVGISAGILITRYQRISKPILGFVNIIQTVPSIALLGFLLPFFGIGVTPAIIALFLYALLPIVRNTYAGIEGVDSAVIEAARGLGMSNRQILRRVELPLATPVIFAGVRTAMIINIGVATLCALIAAGGLGEYIFRGIAVNNVNMILAGAIPASLLAILFDTILGLIQQHIQKLIRPLLLVSTFACLFLISYQLLLPFFSPKPTEFIAGFNSEFMERADGYPGLREEYGFSMEAVEMEIGLMYEALRSGKVNVISGFSTDGRIAAYDLKVLEDNKNYFPPYYAAPLISTETLKKHPQLRDIFEKLEGLISAEEMMKMNYEVDQEKKFPREVARTFLKQAGFTLVSKKNGNAVIVVGSKNFTENFILAEMFTAVIESNSSLVVELKQGFGGTKLLMDAIISGAVDIYPEYTGTGLLVLLQPPAQVVDSLIDNKEKVYQYVQMESEKRFGLTWLQPLGFNNTTALMMRKEDAQVLGIRSIQDLKTYILSLQK